MVFGDKCQDLRLRHDGVVQRKDGGVGVDDRRGDAVKNASLEVDDPESDHNVCHGYLEKNKGTMRKTRTKNGGGRAGSLCVFARLVGWLTRRKPFKYIVSVVCRCSAS